MEKVDCIIIGAGVVGLAIAHKLGNEKREILLLERHKHFGQETSSRNSEVIHAGIYYPAGTLKAELCVSGWHLLYEFCKTNNIPYKKTGKLIVAVHNNDEILLDSLFNKGRGNGVEDLSLITEKQLKTMEPHANATCALYSPSTGILDSHRLMKKLEASASNKGVMCVYGCEVKGVEYNGIDFFVDVVDLQGEKSKIRADVVINSAGLASDTIAQMAGIDIDKEKYRIYFSRGEYFKINGFPPWYMNHLVYPPPGKTSLGIHTVLDLQGQLKLGPNAFYVDAIDYHVDEKHVYSFYHSVKPFLPFIKPGNLSPDMAGIRAKRQAPGVDFADFIITGENDKGLPGLINCIGIESPGLTSCLAIAEYVEKIYRNL
ncbi:MAG: NAD(P)/FAD-dependent oxidoreductase [Spirochaetales bacterium]|nr:NAD(P)/FAD-dependent oxidoreductase [Spirochaetales bacterium]